MNVVYTCPMHPEVQAMRPGMCPECGMALVPSRNNTDLTRTHAEVDAEQHGKEILRNPASSPRKSAAHSAAFLRKFWVSLVLTGPVLVYSELPRIFLGWTAPAFPGSAYLQLALASIVFFYGGEVFLKGAYREIKGRLPGMMTLIAIAISAAYLFSVFSVFYGETHTLFWELTTLITVMLLGHWLEMKAVQGAQGALRELSKLLPDEAIVIRGSETKAIPLSDLKVGDITLIKPGSKIPVDGLVVAGSSDVNESLVTGESRPVSKKVGNEVIAGTINGDGSLQVKVTKIGQNTFLAGVMRLVAEAQASKSRLQILSDRAAFYLTVIAVSGGALTFGVWLLAKAGLVFATERLVAVLVVACPHALGLAVPLVASISTTLAARNGFLIKQRLALEAARNIDVVMFDKTGTLTKGEYGVTDILSATPVQNPKSKIQIENEILGLAASVDAHSEHFAARAIVEEAKRRELKLLPVADFARVPGKGVRGRVDGEAVFVGGEAIIAETQAALAPALAHQVKAVAQGGRTVIFVIKNQAVVGALALADIIRDESRAAIASLKAQGKRVAMITGDSSAVADWVAKELNIDEVFAKVLPEQKAQKVKWLQAQGQKVAFVGDGVNDAPALTQADLGVAIGAGTNVAIESAGIILVKNDPRDIPKIIELSRLTYAKMIQNLWWASGYNIVALPLAAGVLAAQGIILQPALAAALMSLSTVIVAFNAMFLRQVKLE